MDDLHNWNEKTTIQQGKNEINEPLQNTPKQNRTKDLAEIAIAQSINPIQCTTSAPLPSAKTRNQTKSKEKDIPIINKTTKLQSSLASLKSCDNEPRQLSADKNLQNVSPARTRIRCHRKQRKHRANCLPIPPFPIPEEETPPSWTYDEKARRYNILVFDHHREKTKTVRISRETGNRGRKHPVYRFYDANNAYIYEVRCGNAASSEAIDSYKEWPQLF